MLGIPSSPNRAASIASVIDPVESLSPSWLTGASTPTPETTLEADGTENCNGEGFFSHPTLAYAGNGIDRALFPASEFDSFIEFRLRFFMPVDNDT